MFENFGFMDAFNIGSSIGTHFVNRRLQREAWEREDNAVQRRVRDMEKAGINPILAAGNPASSSGPIRAEAPHGKVENMMLGAQMAQAKAGIEHTKVQNEAIRIQNKLAQVADRRAEETHRQNLELNKKRYGLEEEGHGWARTQHSWNEAHHMQNLEEQRQRTQLLREQILTHQKGRGLTDKQIERITEEILGVRIHNNMSDYEFRKIMPQKLALLEQQLLNEVAEGNLKKQTFERWERNLKEWMERHLYDMPNMGGTVGSFLNYGLGASEQAFEALRRLMPWNWNR